MIEAPIPETLLSVIILTIPLAVFLLLIVLLLKRRPSKSRHIEPTARVDASQSVEPQAFSPPLAKAEKKSLGADAASIKKAISEAENRGASGELAALYLELARSEATNGSEGARMAALRSAAGHGSLHGPRSVHAEARMELAEVAYASGDLTSACEHWQIARMAYYEDGNADAQAGVDKRMRDNGCPTDWVLTDF